MKVKFSVIPFIPVALVMVVFKLMSIFGLDESGCFLGMNKMNINYAVIGLSLGLFLLCILINIFDRKTAPVYPVKRNIVSGILSIFSGAAIMGSSIVTLLSTPFSSEYYIITLICAAFSVFAGVAFIVMSKAHFIGKSMISKVSGLFIFPALWGCSQLVCEFLKSTRVSVSATDMTPLFCYIFITLYFFSHSMIVARIKGRNSVKACFIYGLPAVALSVAYGVYEIVTYSVESSASSQLMFGLQFLIPALYILSFIIEMTFNLYTKDELEIIDGFPRDDEESFVKTEEYEDIVFSRKDGALEPNVVPDADYYENLGGFNDLVLGYEHAENSEPITYKEQEDFVKAESPKKDVDFALPPTQNTDENDGFILSDIDILLQELENKK